MATTAEVDAYIRDAAKARGIPDWLAVGIAKAESGPYWGGDPSQAKGDYYVPGSGARYATGPFVSANTPGAVPTSYGPFQLHFGGLGSQAQAAGIDITDPSTWKKQVDFALDFAAQRGTFAGTWSTALGDLGINFAQGKPNVPPIPPKVTGPADGGGGGFPVPKLTTTTEPTSATGQPYSGNVFQIATNGLGVPTGIGFDPGFVNASSHWATRRLLPLLIGLLLAVFGGVMLSRGKQGVQLLGIEFLVAGLSIVWFAVKDTVPVAWSAVKP